MQSRRAKHSLRRSATGAEVGHELTILVVGDLARWRGAPLPRSKGFRCVAFHELTPELLELVRPQIVLSPLLCSAFDCMDLADVLARAGFRGRYRALSPDLPEPELIRTEIRSACPGLDFDIVSMAGPAGRTVN